MLTHGYSNWNGMLLSEQTGMLEPLCANEAVHEELYSLNELRKKGMLGTEAQNLEDGNYLVYVGNGLFRDQFADAIVKVQGYAPMYSALSCTSGVVDNSQKKEEALQFLTLMYTDHEIGNLIIYGIEGRDYRLTDGEVELLADSEGNMRIESTMLYPLVTGISETQFHYFTESAYPSKVIGYAIEDAKMIEAGQFWQLKYEEVCDRLIMAEDFEQCYLEVENELREKRFFRIFAIRY